MMRIPDRSRGFTLLEVLIAFTIAAIALVSLVQAFGTGLRQVDRMDATTKAVLFAEAKLAELSAAPALTEGEAEGETPGGGRWGVTVSPRPSRTDAPVAYDIRLVVEVDGAVVELDTVRLGAAP